MTTTIEISVLAGSAWRRWCRASGLTSVELMDKIVDECGRHHQRALYLSLPMPDKRCNPLAGVKIDKKYRK